MKYPGLGGHLFLAYFLQAGGGGGHGPLGHPLDPLLDYFPTILPIVLGNRRCSVVVL